MDEVSAKARAQQTSSLTFQSLQQRYLPLAQATMRAYLDNAEKSSGQSSYLSAFYGQMRYHLGWVDATFVPVHGNTGKMLRLLLVILAYEAAGAWGLASSVDPVDMTHLRRVMPVAATIELTHNFTLIHDDIEDGDTQRRHRDTVWKCWGVPHAINTGDGLFALSRQGLWATLKYVEGDLVAQLGMTLDRTVQIIIEGQYLDLSFEGQDVSVTQYLEMIRRKTATLMSCAAEMGARLATQDQTTIACLRAFGEALGLAFQVRDDILGVWASAAELGKVAAGDITRRKKSLPILHALQYASSQDQHVLHMLYQSKDIMTQAQVHLVLEILERTRSRAYCSAFLAEQCRLACEALARVPSDRYPAAGRAIHDLETLIHCVSEV